MKGVPQGRYTREFRQEAVKLIVEEKNHVVKQPKGCPWLPQHSVTGSKPIKPVSWEILVRCKSHLLRSKWNWQKSGIS
jgi:hypothetical protein